MISEITDGHWVDATFRLERRTLTIGRDPRNVVQIPDDNSLRPCFDALSAAT
ncbi:MAG: hypothetical protein ACI9OJ_003314 [Myxococcota bacterium]|jgi:hypothetical protein